MVGGLEKRDGGGGTGAKTTNNLRGKYGGGELKPLDPGKSQEWIWGRVKKKKRERKKKIKTRNRAQKN